MKISQRRILMVLVGFQGLSGLAGGIGLILDPSGKALSIPQEWLSNTLFDTYFIPGATLFVVLGIFPIASFGGLWKQKRWAISGSLITGIALMIWIAVEIYLIGYHSNPPLQLIYGTIGVLITLFSWINLAEELNKMEPV